MLWKKNRWGGGRIQVAKFRVNTCNATDVIKEKLSGEADPSPPPPRRTRVNPRSAGESNAPRAGGEGVNITSLRNSRISGRSDAGGAAIERS